MQAIRWSTPADSPRLAELHREAWRYAYSGIIPGLTLERMISRRGPGWWRVMHRFGAPALVMEFDGRVAGYTTLGPRRGRGFIGQGEIYELYLRPECHGLGFGRRLFRAARRRLSAAGFSRLTVWSLADNEVGCRFYRGVGGVETGRTRETIGGAHLEKIGFGWD